MNWNDHSKLDGQHAFLGASQHSWLNYSEQKLVDTYKNRLATIEGTLTHEFAALCIARNQRLPKSKQTLNQYVNDAIGFGLSPEVILYYSENCFGTADAISFRDNFLRIHDLKTGKSKTHIEQLEIYAALFCLEYRVDPKTIEIELRIYQGKDILYHNPTDDEIQEIMDKIIKFDKLLEKVKEEL